MPDNRRMERFVGPEGVGLDRQMDEIHRMFELVNSRIDSQDESLTKKADSLQTQISNIPRGGSSSIDYVDLANELAPRFAGVYLRLDCANDPLTSVLAMPGLIFNDPEAIQAESVFSWPTRTEARTITLPNASGEISLVGHVHDDLYISIIATPTSGNIPTITAGGELQTSNYQPLSFHLAHGIEDRAQSTISLSTRDFTIAPTGASFNLWIEGVKYAKTSSQTTLADTVGLHFVYFDSGGALQSSMSAWDITSSNSPVATIYWNGAAGAIIDERHGSARNRQWHEWAHESIGTRYVSGLAGTFTATTFTITSGEIYDEDLEHLNAEQTACRLWYRSSGAFTFTAGATSVYKLNGSSIQYDNGTDAVNATSNRYVNHWVYACGDPAYPIYVIVGQAQHSTLAAAQAETPPTTGNLPVAEMKLLYAVTYRNTGSPPTYVETRDYRSSVGPVGTFVATDHGSLSGLGDDDHTQYLTTERADALYISIVGSPTEGNFPTLTADGELANSAYGPSSFAASGHNHTGVYEPALGNPAADGYVLSSTMAGVRSWVEMTGGGGITGLTTNTIPKASSATSLSDSRFSDNGTTVTLTQSSTVADQNMMKIVPYAAHPEWIPLKFSTGHADFGDFTFSCNSGTFDAGVRDPYMFWGYNVLPNGKAQNKTNSQAAMYLGIEGYYAVAPTNHISEFYVQYSPNDDTDGLRPFSVGVYHETKTSNVNIKTSNFTVDTDAGVNKWQITPSTGYWECQSGTSFRFAGNNTYGFTQKNAAGSAYVNILKINASDILLLGEDYAPSIYNVQTFGTFNAFGSLDHSSNDYYSLNISRTGFGNTLAHAQSIIWGYSGGSATILGKLSGYIETGGGTSFRFYTRKSSTLTEVFRVMGGDSAAGVLVDHIGELTTNHNVVFDNKVLVDHIGQNTTDHTVVFDDSVSIVYPKHLLVDYIDSYSKGNLEISAPTLITGSGQLGIVGVVTSGEPELSFYQATVKKASIMYDDKGAATDELIYDAPQHHFQSAASDYTGSNSLARIGAWEFQSFSASNAIFAQNIYYDGGGWKYRNDGYGVSFQGLNGSFIFYGCNTGTGGAAASPAQLMSLSGTTGLVAITYDCQIGGAAILDRISELTSGHGIIANHKLITTPGLFITDDLTDTAYANSRVELRGDTTADVTIYLHSDGVANPTIYMAYEGSAVMALFYDYSTSFVHLYNASIGTYCWSADPAGKVGIGGITAPTSVLDVNGDIETTSTGAHYFGDPTTDGTYKVVRDGNDLVTYRRESGTYVEKSRVTA